MKHYIYIYIFDRCCATPFLKINLLRSDPKDVATAGTICERRYSLRGSPLTLGYGIREKLNIMHYTILKSSQTKGKQNQAKINQTRTRTRTKSRLTQSKNKPSGRRRMWNGVAKPLTTNRRNHASGNPNLLTTKHQQEKQSAAKATRYAAGLVPTCSWGSTQTSWN